MNAYKKVQNHHNLHINFNRISLHSTPVLAPQKSIYKKEKKKDTPRVNLATQPWSDRWWTLFCIHEKKMWTEEWDRAKNESHRGGEHKSIQNPQAWQGHIIHQIDKWLFHETIGTLNTLIIWSPVVERPLLTTRYNKMFLQPPYFIMN